MTRVSWILWIRSAEHPTRDRNVKPQLNQQFHPRNVYLTFFLPVQWRIGILSTRRELLTCTYRVVYTRTCVCTRVCSCVYVYLCIQTMSSLTRTHTHNSLSGMRFYNETKSDEVRSVRVQIGCAEARFSPFGSLAGDRLRAVLVHFGVTERREHRDR